ncbi:hypothetical protein CDAR_446701 [Caerostris darwini]|uniref:Uncharacterized protein n=1 Tax=Caerostris darwini TaxID=1538125 RepID=A0AAV4RJM8_9ARAC|nr:hypothetical protein CDAR_446701 [Caerostris darwini]
MIMSVWYLIVSSELKTDDKFCAKHFPKIANPPKQLFYSKERQKQNKKTWIKKAIAFHFILEDANKRGHIEADRPSKKPSNEGRREEHTNSILASQVKRNRQKRRLLREGSQLTSSDGRWSRKLERERELCVKNSV